MKSLQVQWGLLLLKLLRVPHASIHVLLGVNHKDMAEMDWKLCCLRKEFVESEKEDIVFGDGKVWKDVEADTWLHNCLYDISVAPLCILLQSVFAYPLLFYLVADHISTRIACTPSCICQSKFLS